MAVVVTSYDVRKRRAQMAGVGWARRPWVKLTRRRHAPP